MKQKRYVLNLIENSNFGRSDGNFIGYWTGKQLRADDIRFPGVSDDKHNKDVKVYTSKKRAENAVKKLEDKFTYVSNAVIEVLD